MSKRTYIVEIISQIVKGDESERVQTAELITDRLIEEGVLNLGYGNADVDAIIDKFTTTFGTTKTSRFDRFAAHRLAERYGAKAVVGIIEILGQNAGQKYAPVVNNISELEHKLPSVLNFVRSIDGEEIAV